jgi:hypothetical protein
LDEGAIDTRGGIEVKVSQGLAVVTSGLSQPTVQASLVAAFEFIIQEQGQELGGSELSLGSLGSLDFEGERDTRELELAQFGEKGVCDHACTSSVAGKNSAGERAKANV